MPVTGLSVPHHRRRDEEAFCCAHPRTRVAAHDCQPHASLKHTSKVNGTGCSNAPTAQLSPTYTHTVNQTCNANDHTSHRKGVVTAVHPPHIQVP